jgi:hypothetical protein
MVSTGHGTNGTIHFANEGKSVHLKEMLCYVYGFAQGLNYAASLIYPKEKG